MNDPPQTRLEWMRSEFQDARRRHMVKAGKALTEAPGNVEERAVAPAIVTDAVVISLPDHSTPQ
jgi:hypothetical protein